MDISLYQNWDYAPHIQEEEVAHRLIPRAEKSLLVDFLERRAEGALLMSGKRGVGKTSAIFDAIHEVITSLKSKKTYVLPVLVNAPNFEIWKGKLTSGDNSEAKRDDESKELIREGKTQRNTSKPTDLIEFKRVVLQNLVRRLYQLTSNLIIIENDGDSIKLLPILEESVLPLHI